MSAFHKQIGGDHYKDLDISPFEFIERNGLGYGVGNIIKYLCRYKTKGGIEDLEKARHYLDMLIEREIRNELDFDGPDHEKLIPLNPATVTGDNKIPEKKKRIMRLPEVIGIVGVCRSTIYFWMEKKTFPKPIKLGKRSIGWLEKDIQDWISQKKGSFLEENE